MNRLYSIIACLACLLIASAQQLPIGSYNIRFFVPNDEAQGHVWLTRCQVMCDMINYEAPETFGAQEVVGRQYNDMLTGDLNVDQASDTYSIFVNDGLLVDTYETAKFRFAQNGTFNNFDTAGYTTSRIDHIMVTRNIEAQRSAILTNSYWSDDKDGGKTRRNPSDHYPVFVKLLLK